MRSRSFTVTGFTLPVPMVYSMAPSATAQAVGISTSENGARAFVMRIIMQAVYDVLEQQGRAAGLPDPIIQIILGQLIVNISYQPLKCDAVSVNPMPAANIAGMLMMNTCVIIGNTVTSICLPTMANALNCVLNAGTSIVSIPAQHFNISGTLTTTNVIMANWSREMWQSVVNRVVRTLVLGPYGMNFFSAFATVS